MKQTAVILVMVAVLAATGGYFVAMKFAPEMGAAQEDTGLIGQHRPEFNHRDLNGKMVSPANFEGKVLLVNFWATWCAPCVEEMPMLSELQEGKSGGDLQVIGIAIDDPARAAGFARDMGLSYPVLLGEADVVITGKRYGNDSGMLPFSVLIDKQGVVRWTHLGALDFEDLGREIKNLTGAAGP